MGPFRGEKWMIFTIGIVCCHADWYLKVVLYLILYLWIALGIFLWDYQQLMFLTMSCISFFYPEWQCRHRCTVSTKTWDYDWKSLMGWSIPSIIIFAWGNRCFSKPRFQSRKSTAVIKYALGGCIPFRCVISRVESSDMLAPWLWLLHVQKSKMFE